MRRLTGHLAKARLIHRTNGERGAVAVITAVSLVVLLLAAAIAIDVGLMAVIVVAAFVILGPKINSLFNGLNFGTAKTAAE